ncbi:MAG: class I SAM-dependent DNA methyltransferase, partial [Planctomycetes bacterium]|nr:class I SAM-dependent DNA methyltransferase [Planctomycetota bacterium]
MTPQEFIAKWKPVQLKERSACQEHFLDLCEVLDQPKPAKADPEGSFYTFERGVTKTSGDHGWADVWFREHFGWEYKGKHKDLKAAYDQLLQYREDLQNPPLLVVCDLDRFEIHTNFTGTVKKVFSFDLDSLAEPHNLEVLRKLFTDPQALKPGQTAEAITQQAAELFGQIADGMRQRGVPAEHAAHFLMKLMFCMFAEDIGLLPQKLFTRTLAGAKNDPGKLSQLLGNLFEAMSSGGLFGADEILYFNGGLFADSKVVDLKEPEIKTLVNVNTFDWSSVEPSIFGTLFERTLNPAKRSQIGAHYTSREDILTLLEPVMMTPLRREWVAVQQNCEKLNAEAAKVKTQQTRRRKFNQRDKALRDFVERLAHVTVLDPACGSGNFLYVALHLLLDLEKEVIAYAARQGIGLFPHVRPTQLAGIEINRYAQELAQVVIWIGYLQWMRDNGFAPPRDPVLEPIESIRLMDAILDLTNPNSPMEPEWPEAEFIVSNPPFLGDKKMKSGLGEDYVSTLRTLYGESIPGGADFVTFWFEKARHAIQQGRSKQAGLLSTQSIRVGANRSVLDRIKKSGDIFMAWS